MANVALFRAGQLPQYLVSVNTPDYQADPDALINPDISLLGAVPLKYWKRVVNAVQEQTVGEKATTDASIAAALLASNRAGADSLVGVSSGDGMQLRAVVGVLVDEINTLLAALPRPIASITRSGTVATATTPTAHGMQTGQSVAIFGADVAAYNGVKSITVTGATTFTYPGVAGNPATPVTGTILYALDASAAPLARTLAQAKTAYQNKIANGSAD